MIIEIFNKRKVVKVVAETSLNIQEIIEDFPILNQKLMEND